MSYSPTNNLNKFNQPSLVQFENLKFLIMDSPSDLNIEQYVKELVRHGTTDIVRACEPHYQTLHCDSAGITCHDCEFTDGDPPPLHIINKWLDIIESRYGSFDGKTEPEENLIENELHQKVQNNNKSKLKKCVAVHCVAGLGRAPMLVAVALMEAGFDAEDAVELIRKTRRGAINTRQFDFLLEYIPKRGKRQEGCCTIS